MATALSWALPSSGAHWQLWHSPCRNGHLQGLSWAVDLSPHQGNPQGELQAELGECRSSQQHPGVVPVGGNPCSYSSRMEGAQRVSAVGFEGHCTVLWHSNVWRWGWGLFQFGNSHRLCAAPSSAVRQEGSPEYRAQALPPSLCLLGLALFLWRLVLTVPLGFKPAEGFHCSTEVWPCPPVWVPNLFCFCWMANQTKHKTARKGVLAKKVW